MGRSLERKEILSATEGEPLPDGAKWTRVPVGVVGISDLANGKIVTLDAKNKRFHEVKSILGISPDDGKVSESKVKAEPQVDFYARIRDLPIDKAEQLPEQEVAGKKAVGFRTEEKVERAGGVDTWVRTYWVDVESNLPVQIETTFESTNPRMGGSRWMHSDIVFDAPLDASLFSTDPPEGYEVQE